MAAQYFAQTDQAFGQKRKGGHHPSQPAAKEAHLNSGPDSEDAWTCLACGNFNYGGRAVCNMKTCSQPKPIEAWTCPSCGNENLANRPFCNMRSCGLAKPGLRAQDMAPAASVLPQMPQTPQMHHMGQMQQNPMQQMQQQMRMQQMPMQQMHMQQAMPTQMAGGQSAGGPGQWNCGVCGNVNWEKRSTCNGQKGTCGVPRPGAGTGNIPPVLPHAGGATNAAYGAAAHVQHMAMRAPQVSQVPMGGGDPEGSWACPQCLNVNWPQRSSCNKKGCGLPRPAGL